MVDMNLIPDDYQQEHLIKKALIYFTVACTVVLLCLISGKAFFSYFIWRDTADLAHKEQILQTKKASAAESLRKKQIAEQKIATLNALRGHEHVSIFLSAIDQAHTDGVWFKRINYVHQHVYDTAIATTSESTVSGTLHRAVVMGHALNHSMLATFMRQLNTIEGMADLHLVNTGASLYANTPIVDFNLSVNINETNQRQSI